MKKMVFLSMMIVGLFPFSKAFCQIHTQTPNEPKEDIKVNREYDENGNVIRYDSTYSWSWSSTGDNGTFPDSVFQFYNGFGSFSSFNVDSLFQQFNMLMQGSMFPDSMFFNEPFFHFNDPFGQFGTDIQSMFDQHFQQFLNDPFFDHPGNSQEYDEWMEKFKQQMDSVKQNQPQLVPQGQSPKPIPKKVLSNQPVKYI